MRHIFIHRVSVKLNLFQCLIGKGYRAEDIKKRWQEYTEELYKKDLHDQDNHDGLITHLQPDTLECKVKWAIGSMTMNKASLVEVMEFQLSYFKS